MRFYGEMRVQGSGPLDGARFDALAYALAEIEETDPAVDEVDLTASLAQGWITASMVIDQESLELAVAKLMATVRTAIYPNGDTLGGWKFLTETAGLTVQPAAARAAASQAGDARHAAVQVPGAQAPGVQAPGAQAPGAQAPGAQAPGSRPAGGSGAAGMRPAGSPAADGPAADGRAQVAQHS
ncbi:MAG TPA: hypothetical protein VIP48_13840 [Streptosporangiaceae bacterium]